jgi:hypothetical protein
VDERGLECEWLEALEADEEDLRDGSGFFTILLLRTSVHPHTVIRRLDQQ